MFKIDLNMAVGILLVIVTILIYISYTEHTTHKQINEQYIKIIDEWRETSNICLDELIRRNKKSCLK